MWYIHVILSNTKAGRGALNHIFLLNIGIHYWCMRIVRFGALGV
jgi:hypothetical protein